MFNPSLQTILGGGNLTAVFCDTGWEHPDTYKHVNDCLSANGCKTYNSQIKI
jgi:hypothetical protein